MSGESPISTLATEFNDRPNLFIDFILRYPAGGQVYNRIINCPRYPHPNFDVDTQNLRESFANLINHSNHSPSVLLSILYESAFDSSSRKPKGQFFISKSASDWVVDNSTIDNAVVLDAGAGTGTIGGSVNDCGTSVQAYLGIENDPLLALASAISLNEIGAPDNHKIFYGNFLNFSFDDLDNSDFFPSKNISILSNPPFVRSHRLENTEDFEKKIKSDIGLEIKGQAGLHAYFLLKSIRIIINHECEDRSISILLPKEFEGSKHGDEILTTLTSKFRINKMELSVDESQFVNNYLKLPSQPILFILNKSEKAIHSSVTPKSYTALGELANISRGISTGANDFFLLKKDDVKKYDIPDKYLQRIIPPKISHNSMIFDTDDWEKLRNNGYPCYLLDLPEDEDLGSAVNNYLRKGKEEGIQNRHTCKKRDPWFKIPNRPIPEIVYTYMTRDDPRFILNRANCLHLSNLLGMVLYYNTDESNQEPLIGLTKQLNKELNDWLTSSEIGRTYEGGLLKIEPNELERLPISVDLQEKLVLDHQRLDDFEV